AGKITFRE
ncbi:hypothetical protein D027_0799B, partial [Vibrio parahaemolyticus 861]